MAMTLRLKPALQSRLTSRAEQMGVSAAAVISIALDGYLAYHEDKQAKRERSEANAYVNFQSKPDDQKQKFLDYIERMRGQQQAELSKPKQKPNDSCACGSVNGAGTRMKFKKCCGHPSARNQTFVIGSGSL